MGKQPVKYFVVDAFTDLAFKGNPAAVCLLDEEKDDQWLQSVASEFNLSETCYLTSIAASHTPKFHLRWFTTVAEVNLCGHATLAASYVLFSNGLVYDSDTIEFASLSGILKAKKIPKISLSDASDTENSEEKDSFLVELNLPIVPISELNSVDVDQLSKALNTASIIDVKRTTTEGDLFVVLESSKAVTEVQPNFDEIRKFPGYGIIVSGAAPSDSGFDFYSRYFAPKFGINEDPVTGSVHCALAPYWKNKLGKCDLVAYQASARGGVLKIHLDEQNRRVLLRGNAVTIVKGSLLV